MTDSDPLLDDVMNRLRPSFEELAAPRPGDELLLANAVSHAAAAGSASWTLAGWLASIGGVVAVGVAVLAVARPLAPPPAPKATVDASPHAAVVAPARAVEVPELELEPDPSIAPLATELAEAPEAEDDITPEPAPKPQLSAEQMLERANAARRAGDHARAVSRYRALERSYPRSRAAGSARIARGRLLLGPLARPRDARGAFESYLRTSPQGSLAPEAHAGLARACRALGDHSAEREAWTTLLARFPNSIYASEAGARLAPG